MLNFGKGGRDGATPPAGGDDLIFDVTDADFVPRVIEASRKRPVIVDFWATWCGPCKTLGPVLEKVVREMRGKVALAKIDVDRNQLVAGQLRIQSIPAVYAFKDGKPVDGFMGALSAPEVRQFVQQLLGVDPEEEDLVDLLDRAEKALADGALTEAAQAFAAALQLEPTELRAVAGLARCYAANGDVQRARQTLSMAPADKQDHPALVAARLAVELAEQTAGAGAKLAEYRAAVERDGANLQARYDLSLALVALGDRQGAVDQLLEIFRRDRTWNEEAAKTQLMKLFEAFGAKDPVTLAGRRRLSSMIFS